MSPPLPHRHPDGAATSRQPRWRTDFPIESAQDEYVSRRDFCKFLVLTSGAMAAGQAYLVYAAQSRRHHTPYEPVAIARDDEVAINQVIKFDYPAPGNPCLLARLDDGKLLAFGQLCTHLLCPVIPEPERGIFLCPCHNGSFDIESGRPLAGPPRRPLPRIVIEVAEDGMIYATAVELRT